MTHYSKNTLIVCVSILLLSSLILVGCRKQETKVPFVEEENAHSKELMQGVWVDEDEGSVVFLAKGDTISYVDSLSESVYFMIVNDTLILKGSKPSKYHIKLLSDNTLRFINNNGDDVSLVKSHDSSLYKLFDRHKHVDVVLNQRVLIKRDTILLASDKRFHAYIQVNPTTYKVLRQTENEDGVMVDNAFYDNIVHLSLYVGANALLKKDFRKQDFIGLLSEEVVSQCVLSDIVVDKTTVSGVSFIAVLSIPDTYSNYNVRIIVSDKGKVDMSI